MRHQMGAMRTKRRKLRNVASARALSDEQRPCDEIQGTLFGLYDLAHHNGHFLYGHFFGLGVNLCCGINCIIVSRISVSASTCFRFSTSLPPTSFGFQVPFHEHPCFVAFAILGGLLMPFRQRCVARPARTFREHEYTFDNG